MPAQWSEPSKLAREDRGNERYHCGVSLRGFPASKLAGGSAAGDEASCEMPFEVPDEAFGLSVVIRLSVEIIRGG